jgi:phosphoribosylformimino-5-aminoimidazole carboxamide ribotide isomerase
MSFTILPAIDVRHGAIVRLSQGDYEKQTTYAAQPIETIGEYAADGASWLHLVDLDAAREGRYTLLPLVKEIRAATSLQIQTGGGVRHEEDVAAIIAAGATRVVVGTVAVREPEKVAGWLGKFGADRLTLALDTRQDERGVWRLPVRGWTESTPHTLESLLGLHAEAGLRHVLCTDIARDGMLTGFNTDLYRSLALRFPQLEIQASGGVRSIADIQDAKRAGASAAILGRALLEGRFGLKEALEC